MCFIKFICVFDGQQVKTSDTIWFVVVLERCTFPHTNFVSMRTKEFFCLVLERVLRKLKTKTKKNKKDGVGWLVCIVMYITFVNMSLKSTYYYKTPIFLFRRQAIADSYRSIFECCKFLIIISCDQQCERVKKTFYT